MYRFLAVLSLTLSGFVSGAYAASHCASLLDRCACSLPLDQFDPATTALLSDIIGDVNITTATQYSPADATVPLSVNDGVVVLENSSAFLTFGPICARQLPAQSSLVIRDVEGCACADLVEAETEAAAGNGNGGAVLGAALAGGAFGTGLYFLIEEGDDDNGNPVTP